MANSQKRKKLHSFSLFLAILLLSPVLFIGSLILITDGKERLSTQSLMQVLMNTRSRMCENQNRPLGSETLPRGIIVSSSDLEMRPLWSNSDKKKLVSLNLLAMAVGIRQKESVNKIIQKVKLQQRVTAPNSRWELVKFITFQSTFLQFISSKFVVMLFHYDGNMNDWKDLEWNDKVLHVSAINQTKWWFAKRFLHPDIVSIYSHIFLWDEDLGVEHFNVNRYLSIIKEERLEISQPALDPNVSEVHHAITARQKGESVHRRMLNVTLYQKFCDENSSGPPCSGWVEMMAPVFSKAAWRCMWYMIQNDFVHAWGLDFHLGYCAQGDRTKNVGVVDSEYIVHYGLPTLGGSANRSHSEATVQAGVGSSVPKPTEKESLASSKAFNLRDAVREQSWKDLERFKNRWKKAILEDKCWVDPYKRPPK